MSAKFRLVKDTDDESPFGAIQRHMSVVVIVAVILIVALVGLTFFSIVGSVRTQIEHQRAAEIAMMTRTAMPTRTPRPTPTITPMPTLTPIPNIPVGIRRTTKPDSVLREGPGSDYTVISTMPTATEIILVGQDAGGAWYQVNGGAWIAATDIAGYHPHLRVVHP